MLPSDNNTPGVLPIKLTTPKDRTGFEPVFPRLAGTLPTELRFTQFYLQLSVLHGWTRTSDPPLCKVRDLDPRPPRCKRGAPTQTELTLRNDGRTVTLYRVC